MKKSIATTLSVIGVLGAGSAAALVNTQVLSSGPAEATASAALQPPADQVDLTVPALSTLPVTTVPVTLPAQAATTDVPADVGTPDMFTEGTRTSTTTSSTASASSTWLTAFNVGESGVVTVDVVSGKLIIVDVEPLAGWTINGSEERDDNSIEVEFASATVRVEFTATFVDGQIVPAVESSAIPAPAANNPAPAAPAPVYHDDDDEYEHDDHDNDHDDEYEHEEDDDGGERDDD